MMTQVEFKSFTFPPYEDEEEEINPCLWGKRHAEYLVQKLAELGVEAEDIIAEDWGYYVPVRIKGFELALCCGHQNGDYDEFLCCTEPSKPLVKNSSERLIPWSSFPRSLRRLRKFCLLIQTSGKLYGQNQDKLT